MRVELAGEDGIEEAQRAGVDAFMARVVADPASHARLGTCRDAESFSATALEVAGGYGMTLSAATIRARLRPDALVGERWGAAPVTLDGWPASGWLPVRSVPDAGAVAIDWAWFGMAPLADSFYEDSTRQAAFLPFNQMFRTRTTLPALIAGSEGQDDIEPSGFIFHMSRCGSTLLSRMLMAIDGHSVASEPEPVDGVVQRTAAAGLPLDARIAALRAIVAALGRVRSPDQRRCFIKLDSWHTLDLPLFRAAFPDVPWLFLYRDPVEVMVSQMTRPGLHAVPGILNSHMFGISEVETMEQGEYCARVLARICEAVVQHWPLGGGMLVDYREIASAMETTIPQHFGFPLAAADRTAMGVVSGEHSKQPRQAFTPDGESKRQAASEAVNKAVAAHLAPAHAALERLRLAQDRR